MTLDQAKRIEALSCSIKMIDEFKEEFESHDLYTAFGCILSGNTPNEVDYHVESLDFISWMILSTELGSAMLDWAKAEAVRILDSIEIIEKEK